MVTNSTTSVNSSLIVGWDQAKSYRTTGSVSPRQESIIPIPFNSHWIQITRTTECYWTANSTNHSTGSHSYACKIKRHYNHCYLKLVKHIGRYNYTPHGNIATCCLSKRTSYNHSVSANNIVWIIIDGYGTGEVWTTSISDSLCHLNYTSINCEVNSISLPCDFSRSSPSLTGKCKNWIGDSSMLEAINCGNTLS